MIIEFDPHLMSDYAHQMAFAIGQAIAKQTEDEDSSPELEEAVVRGTVLAALIFMFAGAYLRSGSEIERRFADAVRDMLPVARAFSTGTTVRPGEEPEPETETRQ